MVVQFFSPISSAIFIEREDLPLAVPPEMPMRKGLVIYNKNCYLNKEKTEIFK